jgi:hypothetical protein
MSALRIKRGTRAQLDAAAANGVLASGELYALVDESRLAVGLGASAYQAFMKQGEGASAGVTPDVYAFIAAHG